MSDVEPPRIRCPYCGMSFVVGDPPSRRTEVGTCGDRRCRRVHWTSSPKSTGPVVCGVWPEGEGS